jgi:hypothetical protein
MSEATSGNVEKRKEGKGSLSVVNVVDGSKRYQIFAICQKRRSVLFSFSHPSDEIVGRSQSFHYVVDRASAGVESKLAEAEDCQHRID